MIGIRWGAIIVVASAVALSGQSAAQTKPPTSLPEPTLAGDQGQIRGTSPPEAPLVGDQGQMPVAPVPEKPLVGDQWQKTDQSMVDLVDDGYELVSVIASSSRARIYYLRKQGKVARCREDTVLDIPPPPPLPPLAAKPGQAQLMFVPDSFVPAARIIVECAELVRPSSAKQ